MASLFQDGKKGRMSGLEMDAQRKANVAYEYLCHLEEARKWLEACLEEELPNATELEPALTNGVYLAKLGNFFSPATVSLKKIYDADLALFKERGLHFRHTDNINFWMKAMKKEGLPQIFYPTTTDIYDRKNIPKAIYCLHALSMYLYKLGKAPPMQDLVGEAEFTEQEISTMQAELDKYGIQMPSFGKIGGILANELSVDEAAVHAAVLAINKAIDKGDEAELLKKLNLPAAGLLEIVEANIINYLQNLQEKKAKKIKETSGKKEEDLDAYDRLLTKAELQVVVTSTNEIIALKQRQERMKKTCRGVMEAIHSGDKSQMMACLGASDSEICNFDKENMDMYVEALAAALAANGGKDLMFEQIQKAIDDGNHAAKVNARKRETARQVNKLIEGNCLTDKRLDKIFNTDNSEVKEYKSENIRYCREIIEAVAEEVARPLTFEEIQQAVHDGNKCADKEYQIGQAVKALNDSVANGDGDEKIFELLKAGVLGLVNIREECSSLYAKMLAQVVEAKEGHLSVEELQAVIDSANEYTDHTIAVATALDNLNKAAVAGDVPTVAKLLRMRELLFRHVLPECAEQYTNSLKAAMLSTEDTDPNGWTEVTTAQGDKFYYNSTTGEKRWKIPNGVTRASTQLTRKEIQAIIKHVSSDYKRQKSLEENQHIIVQLQARWRGILLRKSLAKRMAYFRLNKLAIVKLQAHLKGYQQQCRYQQRLAYLKDNVAAVTTIQAFARGWKARKLICARKLFFNDHVSAVIKLQTNTRRWLAQKAYRTLVQAKQPALSTLRRFLHLLEQSDRDYDEEMDIQNLKGKVVHNIRANKELEENLNIMDIKIGLLVKNRLTLDDVVSQSKKLKKRGTDSLTSGAGSKGLKALSKENRARLEGYQHLFYQLQTNPNYLARLIFQMSTGRTTRFMESVILTLFNYASNEREEFLLMKLFTTAMHLELNEMDDISHLSRGNATVIKMVIHFNRGTRGQSSLKELLLPLVKRIINGNAILNTNPVDVYKAWINQKESETGESCGMPYEVSNDQALSHAEVRQRINNTIKILHEIINEFINSIIDNVSKIPYGIRYFAMKLRQSLQEHFPKASRNEVLKAVGYLLYYRFMNPAVVAPDAFDIVEVSIDKGLTLDQRRNLGSIAKVLQHSSANKLFTAENAALAPLNDFLGEAHQKFLNFFLKASIVEEAEDYYHQDEFAEVVKTTKPIVYISVKEICSTHSLILEHIDEVAPENSDPIHVILKELGPAPEVHEILGDQFKPPVGVSQQEMDAYQERLSEAARSEISLMLTSRFEMTADDQSDLRALFVRTKRMVVDLLTAQQGENLKAVLETSPTPEQEAELVRIVKKREAVQEKAAEKSLQVSGEDCQPMRAWQDIASLKELKEKVVQNIDILTKEGIITVSDNYQGIIDAIARDIRHQHRHRQQRKAELTRLRMALESLGKKAKFFEDQSEYYRQYVKVCLDNLAKPKGGQKGQVRKGPLKYSAQRLHEKGVILEIEGLPASQFKNVSFEIHASDVGQFNVSAKFMGVSMEKVQLVFQDLLQLQYEGVAVIKMFDRAKINVNLLIFLINKKFYGK